MEGLFSIKPGEAYRIMTGAPFPEGADTAVKQEDTDCGEETVKVNKSQKPWDNYCFQGEDYKKNFASSGKRFQNYFCRAGDPVRYRAYRGGCLPETGDPRAYHRR